MNNIHDFMFTRNKFLALKRKSYENPLPKKEQEKTLQEKTTKVSNVKDKLFWCYYLLKYGSLEYEMIGKDHFKFKMVECLKIIESQEKKDKDLESELMNEKKISLKSFLKLCEMSKINVCLVKNIMLSEHIFDSSRDTYIININDFSIKKDNIDQSKYWKIDNIEKPLRAYSNYKAQELRDIGKILNLDIMKGEKKFKTKKEIYTMILSKIE